jgi:hypothetical protein
LFLFFFFFSFTIKSLFRHTQYEETHPYERNPSLDSTVSCKIPLTPPHCNTSRNHDTTTSMTTPIIMNNKAWLTHLNSTKDILTSDQSVCALKTFPLLTPIKKTQNNDSSKQLIDLLHSEPDSEDSNYHRNNRSRQTRSGLRY